MSSSENYGSTERELAFKLLAAHAICDDEFPAFYDLLTTDAREAAAQLHITLTDEDVHYIQDTVAEGILGVPRATIRDRASDIRDNLHLDQVTNSW